MSRVNSLRLVAAAGLLAWGLTASDARAGVLITFVQSGSDVVATGSGKLNLAALSSLGNSSYVPALQANLAATTLGASGNGTDYSGITGPTGFGTGNFNAATSASGDLFGVIGVASRLTVPAGYVSGTSLSGSATFAGKTFTSLGLTPGTYVWSWGSGGTADSLTVQVGGVAVPEPSTSALAGVLAAAALARRVVRRRR